MCNSRLNNFTLNGHQKLEKVRVRGPGLSALPTPGSEQTYADLPVFVEVRVQPVRTVTVVVDDRRSLKLKLSFHFNSF